jgi:mRNA-degrading endonuclease toxin of MazEF toxin-antitoxin module
MSIEKSRLTDYVGELSEAKEAELDKALQVALALTMEKSRKGARG